jgi:hypothetical protein
MLSRWPGRSEASTRVAASACSLPQARSSPSPKRRSTTQARTLERINSVLRPPSFHGLRAAARFAPTRRSLLERIASRLGRTGNKRQRQEEQPRADRNIAAPTCHGDLFAHCRFGGQRARRRPERGFHDPAHETDSVHRGPDARASRCLGGLSLIVAVRGSNEGTLSGSPAQDTVPTTSGLNQSMKVVSGRGREMANSPLASRAKAIADSYSSPNRRGHCPPRCAKRLLVIRSIRSTLNLKRPRA